MSIHIAAPPPLLNFSLAMGVENTKIPYLYHLAIGLKNAFLSKAGYEQFRSTGNVRVMNYFRMNYLKNILDNSGFYPQ